MAELSHKHLDIYIRVIFSSGRISSHILKEWQKSRVFFFLAEKKCKNDESNELLVGATWTFRNASVHKNISALSTNSAYEL